MKWFGIGTAVMALAVMASGPIYGQEKPQDSPGQVSPASPGQPSSPGQPRSPTPSGDRTPSQRPADPGPAARADAQGFINDLTIANLAEVQLGKMASEKGSNADVKAFGQMMVQDHTQANDELKQVASQLKVQSPAQVDQKHKDLADKLSKLSGAEFDREYINAMVMGHEEVLGKLRARAEAGVSGAHGAADDRSTKGHEEGLPSVSKNSNKPVGQEEAAKSPAGNGATTGHGQGDEALTRWAAKAMPTVQKHLDRARDIQMKVAR